MTEPFDPATDTTWRWRRTNDVSYYHHYQGFQYGQKSRCGMKYPIIGQGKPSPFLWERCKDCELLRREELRAEKESVNR